MRNREPGDPIIAYHISDLLADLMHLCDRVPMDNGLCEVGLIDFDALVERARSAYEEEVAEEQRDEADREDDDRPDHNEG